MTAGSDVIASIFKYCTYFFFLIFKYRVHFVKVISARQAMYFMTIISLPRLYNATQRHAVLT